MRHTSQLIVFLTATLATACVRVSVSPTDSSPLIDAHDMEQRLTAFAHDTMMGREAGTIWNLKATDYVASQFKAFGLKPAGENGTWFQTVPNIRPRDTTFRAP